MIILYTQHHYIFTLTCSDVTFASTVKRYNTQLWRKRKLAAFSRQLIEITLLSDFSFCSFTLTPMGIKVTKLPWEFKWDFRLLLIEEELRKMFSNHSYITFTYVFPKKFVNTQYSLLIFESQMVTVIRLRDDLYLQKGQWRLLTTGWKWRTML